MSVVVIGGGLVGSVLAIYLARRGQRVEVYERRADPRRGAGCPGGRSINLTLCHRGLAALEQVGLAAAARRISIPARGRVVHHPNGELLFQPYGNDGEAIYSISRNALNHLLLDAAEAEPGVRLHFRCDFAGIDPDSGLVELRNPRSGVLLRRRPDAVFGADGAYSAVRRELQTRSRFDYSQLYADMAYKELAMPPRESWVLEPEALHIWPRGHYMLIAFANTDGSFTCALHMPYEGEPSFASITTEAELVDLFRNAFPDALPLMPTLVEDYFSHPPTSMVTIRCWPWIAAGRVALIGDAAHAVFPSYGQGANCGFEDCRILDRCLVAHGGDWAAGLNAYQRCRKPDADAIAELSIEHFQELRDLVADDAFQLRKTIELRINQLAPQRYMPLYSMVTFTGMSYRRARERDRAQRALVDRVLRTEDVREKLDSGAIDGVIHDLLDTLPLQGDHDGRPEA